MNIKITPTKNLNLSSWGFDSDRVDLAAGEEATIIGLHVAHPTNPLYEVTRKDGKKFAIHRNQLVECGALDPM